MDGVRAGLGLMYSGPRFLVRGLQLRVYGLGILSGFFFGFSLCLGCSSRLVVDD